MAERRPIVLLDGRLTELPTGDSTPGANGGTVTSVGLLAPTTIFNVSGSPITASGTIDVTLVDQLANLVWAGPSSGPAGTPTFRALVSADIPSLDASKITSGMFADARIAASNVTQHQGALSIGWSQLTGLPAFATRWPTWSEVTDKPTTFTPSAHTHTTGDITDLSSYTGFDSRYVNASGDTMTGDLHIEKSAPILSLRSASGVHAYRLLGNANDSVDFGLVAERWTGSAWSLCYRWHNFNFFVHGYGSFHTGSVGSQVFVQTYGWNNGITRWGWVLEPNVALSLYAYDSGGGFIGQALQVDQDAALFRLASDGPRDGGGNLRDVPVVTRNSDHTLTASDRGRKQLKTGSSAVTYTIASGLPDGMTVVVRNRNASGSITIARGSGVELYMAGSPTNADRIVAPWGEALLHHEGSNVWSISGTGVS